MATLPMRAYVLPLGRGARYWSALRANEWHDADHVACYLRHTEGGPLSGGDALLLELTLPGARRVLDLGSGDGRLLALLLGEHADLEGVALDSSPVMLAKARTRFAGEERIAVIEHDLAEPLPALGNFSAVVSSLAIHHLEHERKRSLYAEVLERLEPGGVFANIEHVASPTRRLHLAFFDAIGEPIDNEDPSDRLASVHEQLTWMSGAGFADVDCFWKWRELALLAGTRPA